MLTRIPKTEVRRGMYVEAVECPVVAFGRRRFVLESDDELAEILKAPAIMFSSIRLAELMGAPWQNGQ
jgi:hypothetical protein